MKIDLNKIRGAVENTYILKKILGTYPLVNDKNNPISSNTEFFSTKIGFAYYNKNIFTGKLEFLIKVDEKKYFRPKYINADIKAFEVWEIERKDPSSVYGTIGKKEYTFIPIG